MNRYATQKLTHSIMIASVAFYRKFQLRVFNYRQQLYIFC